MNPFKPTKTVNTPAISHWLKSEHAISNELALLTQNTREGQQRSQQLRAGFVTQRLRIELVRGEVEELRKELALLKAGAGKKEGSTVE
jgi:hypothetical protein